MNWGALVERVARALGVWDRRVVGPDHPLAMNDYPGAVEVWARVRGHGDRGARRRVVSDGDALLLLLAYARGMRLDVGPCKACAERGGGWEWRQVKTWYISPDVAEGYEQHLRQRGWTVTQINRDYRYDHLCSRPCPECAAPSPDVECETCCVRQRDDCSACGATGRVPGPPQPTGRDVRRPEQWAIEAGRVSIQHAAAVLADQLQAQGDQAGIAMAAWLRGECSACEGSGIGRRVPGVCKIMRNHGYFSRMYMTVDGFESTHVGAVLDCGDARFRVEEYQVMVQTPHRTIDWTMGADFPIVAWSADIATSNKTDLTAVEVSRAADDGAPRVVVSADGQCELVFRCTTCRGLGQVLGAPSIAVESILDEALDAYEQDPRVVEHREVARPDRHVGQDRRVHGVDRRNDVGDPRH